MSKKLFALLLAALMVCGAALALADGIAVTDMHGREITLDAPATRIVALTPSDCEILCAIGGGDAARRPRQILRLSGIRDGTARRAVRRGDQH